MRLALPRTSLASIALVSLAGTGACKGSSSSSPSPAADSGPGTAAAAPSAESSPAASLAFLNGFEGEIDGTFKEAKSPDAVPIALMVKGDKLRATVPEKLAKQAGPSPFGAPSYVIYDVGGKKLSMVSDPRKQVTVLDLDKLGDMMKGAPGARAPGAPGAPENGPKTTLTETGKTDTIAGYKCEYWDVKSTYREASICVASEGASWLTLPLTGIPTEKLWMTKLLDGKHFPLRVIGYAKDGTTEEMRADITKIDKRALADSDFQNPPGYQVVDLGAMLQGLAHMPEPMPGLKPGERPAHLPPQH